MEFSRSKLKKLIALTVLSECVILMVLGLMPSVLPSRGIDLVKTANVIRNRLSSCPYEIKQSILNTSLPVSIYDNVSVKDKLFSKCFEINKTNTGLYRLVDEQNFRDVICNTTIKRLLGKWEKRGYTALASYPGSGNTWVRHLLEELTGIHTGGIYMDHGLKTYFKMERYTEQVLVIKTHEPFDKHRKLQFSRAVLIIRDPFDTLLADYNLAVTLSHTEIPTQAQFFARSFEKHVDVYIHRWKEYYLKWLQKFNGQIFVLFYEKLQTDLLNSLTKMAAFFGTDVTLRQLWCIQTNKEGPFRRGRKPEWMKMSNLVDDKMNETISDARKLVYGTIRRHKFDLGRFASN